MRHVKDIYYHKAKKENFAARSVYKLKEMDERQNILRSGAKVLDLGSSPGSWMQYAANKVGSSGWVFGCDIQPLKIHVPPNAWFMLGDARGILDDILPENERFDAIISDMAPSTTGNRVADSGGSAELCQIVLEIAGKRLKREGRLLFKIFQGPFYQQIVDLTKSQYKTVKFLKPKSCRDESKEIYILAQSRTEQKEDIINEQTV